MPSSHIPWFKFFPADFMNGVRGLNPTEVGLYIMMLCRIYEESGAVEYNVIRLATYCGMREATFLKTFEKLVNLGKLTVVNGKVTNARAEIEIRARANDLSIASRAGKASAEKRKQNQQNSATGVEQVFNHSDSEADTKQESDGDGSVRAEAVDVAKPTPRLTSTMREQLLAAMGVGPDGVVGPSKFLGTQADMAEATRWLQLPGITLEIACTEIRAIMARKKDGPPVRFSYFTDALRRLSAALNAEALKPMAPEQPRMPTPQPEWTFDLDKLNPDGSLRQ